MIEEAIVALLAAHAPLQALIAGRCYNTQTPDDESRPHIVFAEVSAHDINGIRQNTGWRTGRYQFTAWASSPTETRAIRNALRGALDRYNGTASGAVVDDIRLETGPSGYDGIFERYYRIADALIDYKEST